MADYMHVLVLQKILSLLEFVGQNIMLLCHYAEQKRIMDNRLAIFVFLVLCSVFLLLSVCIECASFMCMLRLFSIFGELQVPPIGLEYELKCVESFTMDPFGRTYSWNDAMKTREQKIVLVHVDMTLTDRLRWNCLSDQIQGKSVHTCWMVPLKRG